MIDTTHTSYNSFSCGIPRRKTHKKNTEEKIIVRVNKTRNAKTKSFKCRKL